MRPAVKWTGIVVVAVVAVLVLFLALFDWNGMRGPVSRIASEKSGRPVQIGRLDVDPFSLTPSVTIEQLRIANPNWVSETVRDASDHFATVEHIQFKIALLHLLKGDLVLPELILRNPDIYVVRAADGRGNWESSRKPPPKKTDQPPNLPAVKKFLASGGKLRVVDEVRKLHFEGTFASDEARESNKGRVFHAKATGEANGKPFDLKVEGNSLLNVDRDTPYPFNAVVTAGDTKLIVQGVIPEPFKLSEYQANASMSGDDLADLYSLTGLALPNTPPYRVSGRLERKGARIDFRNVAGQIGDSDVHGNVSINTARERPFLDAKLASKSLDVDDLAAPLGAAPSVKPGETVSPKEKALAEAMKAKRKLFPDSKLQVERLRAMDASFQYRADSLTARKLPLKKFSADLKLNDGVLVVSPLSFEMPQGRLSGTVKLDARQDVPVTDIDLTLSGMQLSQFKPKNSEIAPVEGVVLARAKARGHGNSVHEVLSTADGAVTGVLPRGEIREAFAELTGINVARGLGLLVSKDQEQVTVRCGVADFKLKEGKMSAQNLVFDTNNVLITGKGDVDLESERFDLTVRGQPKKLRFLRVRTPIEIEGPLRKPSISVKSGNLAGQTGIAAAIGAVVAPLAAVIAFVDPGLAKDADCGALLAEARQTEAPVKTATRETGSLR